MSQPRPEMRVPVDLELRVWGMGANGRVFSQPARTRNVSAGGALLSGIEHDLKIGDTVGVQCGEKKARCKVVWAINTGSMQKIQVGVQLRVDRNALGRQSSQKPQMLLRSLQKTAEGGNGTRFLLS